MSNAATEDVRFTDVVTEIRGRDALGVEIGRQQDGINAELRLDDRVEVFASVGGEPILIRLPAQIVVPEGAIATARPEHGPGTPLWADASEDYRLALEALDKGVGDAARHLEVLLATEDERDSLTLWHLLDVGERTQRELVFARLAVLAPPPRGVNMAGAIGGNETMRKRWRRELSWYWGKQG